MAMNITEVDIQRLIHDPSIKVREDITRKICTGFGERAFKGREQKIAEEILRLLVQDTATKIRKTMAQELCNHLDVPRDIIWALANDKLDIAEAVLKHSPVFSEDDLMTLVESSQNLQRLHFIAARPSVSASLSDKLVQYGDASVVQTLMSNRNASLNESTLDYLLEEYHNDQSVLESLVYRGGLPYRFAEQLFSLVSHQLKKDLSKRYRLSRHSISAATENAREIAVMEFLSPWMNNHDILDLVTSMHRSKRLTDSVIIRSLCAGNIRFFEAAIAKKAGISISNARVLMLDAGNRGFEALYDAAAMPETFRQAIHVLFKLAQQETQFGDVYHEHFSQRVIERIIQEGYAHSVENMSTLLSIIGQSNLNAPTIH